MRVGIRDGLALGPPPGGETLSGEVGFANFPGQGHPAGQGPLDRFDMRGLIIFNVIGTLLMLPWVLCM